jgi:hypothetical protein
MKGTIEILRGDITKLAVDAVVNAANTTARRETRRSADAGKLLPEFSAARGGKRN